MTSDTPFFSICIPAHNALPLIGDTLASVAMQTFNSWEIIVVDDCSTDGLADWIEGRDLMARGRLRFLPLEANHGPFYARKVAFGAARGSYVLCLDADDELLGMDALAKLRTAIELSPDFPDIVIFNASTDKDGLRPWIDYSSEGLTDGRLTRNGVLNTFLRTQKLNNLCTKAIKRELLLPIDLDDARGFLMCEDRLEVAGVLAKAKSFLLFDKPLYFYRINPASTTHRLFELDYCWQQSHVDRTVLELFPGETEAVLLYGEFLKVWADDMCLITRGRTFSEAAECYAQMGDDSLFREAYTATGADCLRADRRLLLCLLRNGSYGAAAGLAKLLYCSKETAKRLIR